MKRARGFTLMELMIVVAVIAILATLAFSAYSEQTRKAKRAEARRGISQLQLGLEQYRGYCPTYADQVSCRDRNADGDTTDTGEPPYPTAQASAYYTFAVSAASATGYTITATRAGEMANDPKCGNLTVVNLNGTSTQGVSSGDVNYCWGR